MPGERTYELTNYCPHGCGFCSSDTTDVFEDRTELSFRFIEEDLRKADHLDTIILSGGEPLAHRDFYHILELAKHHADHVIVYTNALSHIAYNAHVLDGVYVEAAVTVPDDVSKVRILKRVKQGREARRPEVSFSSNFDKDCADDCKHITITPNGIRVRPCAKER